MSDFHFLRPEWFLALPVAWGVAWKLSQQRQVSGDWGRIMDTHLLRFLSGAPFSGNSQTFLAGWLALWTCLVVALAGPSWQRAETPVLQKQQGRVVVLDLSYSMLAADLKPNRLERAKFKLLDLLKRFREGETALVVYAGDAFVVSPLTPDTNTIANLVPTLEPALMPSPGSNPASGITLAVELLRRQQVSEGTLFWITDGIDASQVPELQQALAETHVVVWAVGTETGAPIPTGTGEFVRDAQGSIVVPHVDLGALQEVSSSGSVVALRSDDQDLAQLLAFETKTREFAQEQGLTLTERWRDEGVWLVWAALPLAAWLFRRGVLWLWVPLLLLPDPAQAFKWEDLWQRPDQQGAELLEQGLSEQAAEAFTDSEWQGVAAYRSGDFSQAAARLQSIDGPRAQYNRGNALARSGDLSGALDAYEQALKLDPEHEDARFNRNLIQKLLNQQEDPRLHENDVSPQNSAEGASQGPESSSPDSSQSQQSTEQPSAAGDSSSKAQQNENASEQSSVENSSESSESRVDSQAGAAKSGPEEAQPEPEGSGFHGNDVRAAMAQGLETPPQKPETPEEAQAFVPQPEESLSPEQQRLEQALRQVPNDPGRLLRNKFRLRQQQRKSSHSNPDQPFW